VKFARTDLIDRVKAEIERLEQAAADRNAKYAQKYVERRQEYLDRTGPAWSELANTIRNRHRKSQPMTADDIPTLLRGGYTAGHVRTWDDDSKPDEYTADTTHLATLLNLLESATDDEITTAGLERMGFRMAQLFRSA
jgi:hypothetical protein